MTATARAGTVTSRLLFTASRLRPDAELADELERMDPGGSSLLALLARHARAAVGSDDRALGEVARLWEACGHAILAAEALAEAVRSAARDGRAGDAARWRQRLAVAMDLEGLVSTPGLRLIDSATPLTAREREIATRGADGLTSKQIAERLYVSPRTITSSNLGVLSIGGAFRADEDANPEPEAVALSDEEELGYLASPVTRLPQAVAVNPRAPAALALSRPVGQSSTQNAVVQARIQELRDLGASEIRVNQQQVDATGSRVGVNRPDLQYTLNGQRFYEEYDTDSSSRGPGHMTRLNANDPNGSVILGTVN